jgi:SNF2 family DNA or RNA helicase
MTSGNVGLNITAANRVIIVTPWWNVGTEVQAFGRVKRHGQKKETYLVRLFAQDSIDERMKLLQVDKEEEIKQAMLEGRKPKPLTREEQLYIMTGKRYNPDSPRNEKADSESEESQDSDGDDSDSDSSYH